VPLMRDEASREIRILIVGCGTIGRVHAGTLQALGVSTLAVCDPYEKNRLALQDEFGIREGYSDLEEALGKRADAVFICTPPALHVRQARLVVEAGCDVFVEKPLSDTLAGVDDLIDLAERQDRLLMVGLPLRFHAGLRRVKQLIDGGAIGRLVSIRAMLGVYLPEGRRIGDYRTMYIARLRGGVILDYLHEIDLVQWVVGATPRQVFAFAGKLSDVEIETNDTAEILLRFDAGLIASIHLDLFQRAKRRETEFMGTQGTILIDLANWNQCPIRIYRAETKRWESETLSMQLGDLFRAEDQEFLRCMATRGKPALDGNEGKKSVETALAAIFSSERGEVFHL
jgi:predicted dehydrogenase